MAEAGYGDGFEVTCNCPNDRYINDEAICQAAVGMLGKIGIKANLVAQTKANHFPLIQNKETDFYLLGWGVPTFDSEYIFNFLVHSTTDDRGSWNGTRFSNPEVDEMIQSLGSETDLEKRNETIAKICAGCSGRADLPADPQPGAELGHEVQHRLPGSAGRPAALQVPDNWLPSFGRGDRGELFGVELAILNWDGFKSMILPAITLGLFQMTLIMRLVRSEMLEVLRADYIKFARARGLSERAINFGHALKNTLVPVITIIGLQLGLIIAFAIVTESVFQWPGVGLLFINSVNFVDIPVMAAYLLLVGVIFVTINLIVDLLYVAIDPRLRVDGGGGH
jgi:hypothetical protein